MNEFIPEYEGDNENCKGIRDKMEEKFTPQEHAEIEREAYERVIRTIRDEMPPAEVEAHFNLIWKLSCA